VFAFTNTSREPSTATLPIPLLIETAVAFDVAHVSVVVPAFASAPGFAVNASQESTGSGSVTVIVRVHETEPPVPTAISSYVRVSVGETVTEPDATSLEEAPPAIDTLVAFWVVQESVAV
jgi:hypothetical protein